MFRWLALTFLVVPFVELWLLLRVGDLIGFWPTMGIVLSTAVLGAWLAKREGLRVFNDWQRALAEMRLPDEGITSGLLVLVGGVLLVAPGVLTDLTGIALMIPPIRKVVAGWIERYAQKRMQSGQSVFDVRVVTPQGAYGRRRVVDVEGVVVEDREIVASRRAPRARVDVIEGSVIEGEVVDATTRRLGSGEP